VLAHGPPGTGKSTWMNACADAYSRKFPTGRAVSISQDEFPSRKGFNAALKVHLGTPRGAPGAVDVLFIHRCHFDAQDRASILDLLPTDALVWFLQPVDDPVHVLFAALMGILVRGDAYHPTLQKQTLAGRLGICATFWNGLQPFSTEEQEAWPAVHVLPVRLVRPDVVDIPPAILDLLPSLKVFEAGPRRTPDVTTLADAVFTPAIIEALSLLPDPRTPLEVLTQCVVDILDKPCACASEVGHAGGASGTAKSDKGRGKPGSGSGSGSGSGRPKKVAYIGIQVDGRVLVDAAKTNGLWASTYSNHSADHVTLVFRPSPEVIAAYSGLVHTHVAVHATSVVCDPAKTLVAARVHVTSLEEDGDDETKRGVSLPAYTPQASDHVTLAWGHGRKPVESRALLESEDRLEVALCPPIVLHGTIVYR
jgi:hypothetical protein